jgi:putative redox protein
MTKQVTVRWHGELDFDAIDEAGAIVPMSSKDTGFGPGRLVLAALGGCTGMDAVSVMTKKKIAFDEYRVEVVGEQRDSYPRSYTSITVEHIVRGQQIADKAVARAIELSARKYCMVGATIASGDCTINYRMRIIDEQGERTCDCLSIGPRGAGLSHYEDA